MSRNVEQRTELESEVGRDAPVAPEPADVVSRSQRVRLRGTHRNLWLPARQLSFSL
jgi:hypothetical protein